MESIDVFAPLASLQWVDRNTIHANDYNPNKVSEENLKLLIQSILTNGWTLPIVVRPDGTIIDGFHRWTVSGREPLLSLLGGKVPVVVVDHHGDESAVASLYNANAELAHLQKIGVKDVCVLWCGSTLQNNKAWLSTTVPDCMYYEATYDGDKKELRLDAYRKIQSVSIPC